MTETIITSVDFESTGLNPSIHAVTEVAAIKIAIKHDPNLPMTAQLIEWFWAIIDHPVPTKELNTLWTPGALLMSGRVNKAISESKFVWCWDVSGQLQYIDNCDRVYASTENAFLNLYSIVQNSWWMGSNPGFDWDFFSSYLRHCGDSPPKLAGRKLIDPCQTFLTKVLSGEINSLSQPAIVKHIGLDNTKHRALADAYQCIQILLSTLNIPNTIPELVKP